MNSYNYFWIGGVWNDVSEKQVQFIRDFCDNFEGELEKYDNLVSANKIFIERMGGRNLSAPFLSLYLPWVFLGDAFADFLDV